MLFLNSFGEISELRLSGLAASVAGWPVRPRAGKDVLAELFRMCSRGVRSGRFCVAGDQDFGCVLGVRNGVLKVLPSLLDQFAFMSLDVR